MHDYDNNSKLDGLELFQGLSHHDHSQDEKGTPMWISYLVEVQAEVVRYSYRAHLHFKLIFIALSMLSSEMQEMASVVIRTSAPINSKHQHLSPGNSQALDRRLCP